MEDIRSITVKLKTVPLDAFHDLCSSCRKIKKSVLQERQITLKENKTMFFLFLFVFIAPIPDPCCLTTYVIFVLSWKVVDILVRNSHVQF
jgi:hypothetical protein